MTSVFDLTPSHTSSEPDPRAVSAAAHNSFERSRAFAVNVISSALAEPKLPLIIEHEADGTVLVADREEQVVGTGMTLPDALHDFRDALRQHVAYLRANRQRLHQRLVADLERLERDFPWV